MQEKETKQMELRKMENEMNNAETFIKDSLEMDHKILDNKEIYCNEINCIENACDKYNEFLENYQTIKKFLSNKYNEFELNYKLWDCEDVIAWLSLIENERFKLRDDSIIHNILDLNELEKTHENELKNEKNEMTINNNNNNNSNETTLTTTNNTNENNAKTELINKKKKKLK